MVEPMPITKSTDHKERGPVRRCCWWFAEIIMMDAVFEASLHEETMDRHRPDI